MINGKAARLFVCFLFLFVVSGCAAGVTHRVYDAYAKSKPYTVAVLPVVWDDVPDDKKEAEMVGGLFRKMSFEKMGLMNYRMQPLEETDRLLTHVARPDRLTEEELLSMKADAALRVRILKWSASKVATYSSLTVKAVFSLYSKGGELLWEGSYSTKESDIKLDTQPMELSILRAYEPRVQRFVDMVLGTLPVAEEPSTSETFFEWLP